MSESDDDYGDGDGDGGIVLDRPSQEAKKDLAPPPRYAVVLLNDDHTPMDFVVVVLEKIFQKNAQEAEAITMEIHNSGKGMAGTYPKDIAETKAHQVIAISQAHQHPFRAEVEALH